MVIITAIHKYLVGKFKNFIKEDEAVSKTIGKLPAHIQEMLKGFEFIFEPRNTLHGDDGHVGSIVTSPKKIIKIASPWFYPREFVLLHEIGHLVWLSGNIKEKWGKIFKANDNLADSSAEENFCHAFANYFSKHKIKTYNHPNWMKFIEKI